MALRYMMQARSSEDGELYGWSSSTKDFAGAGFTGPGTPEDVSVVSTHGQPDAGDLVTTNKEPAFVVIQENVDRSACPVAQDGETLTAGKRVLLVAQTLKGQNALYVAGAVNAGTVPLVRADDADSAEDFDQGIVVAVLAGSAGIGSIWILQTEPPIVVDTTELEFQRSSNPRKVATGDTCAADGTTNDDTAYAAALDTADDLGLPLEISPGTHLITPVTSRVVDTVHRFVKGGILKPSANKTIQFNESARIDASPYHQIFDTSASGSEVRIRCKGTLYANWWLIEGEDIAQAWNRMMAGVRHSASTVSPLHFAIAPGKYTVTHTFDMAHLRAGQNIDLVGVEISGNVGRKKAICDMTASTGLKIRGGKIIGIDCACCIIEARPDSAYDRTYGGTTEHITAGMSSGKNYFEGTIVQGYCSLAHYVNISAEVSTHTIKVVAALTNRYASTTLNGGIDDDDTSVTLTNAALLHDPDDGDGDYYLTLIEQDADTGLLEYEVVKVTARAGNVITVTRAQRGTTARAFLTGAYAIELPRYGVAMMGRVESKDADIINGFGSISPHSDPGNETDPQSSDGFHWDNLYVNSECSDATVSIARIAYCHISNPYINGGVAPHVRIDATTNSVSSVCVDGMHLDHNGDMPTRPKVAVQVDGISQNIEVTHLTFRNVKNIKAGQWAFYFPAKVALQDCVFEWEDDSGFYAHPQCRFDGCHVLGSPSAAQKIVLPTEVDGDQFTNGRFRSGTVRIRDIADLTPAGDMDGTEVKAVGWFDKTTLAVTPTEIRRYGDYGIADRTVGGFRVEGRRGVDLRDEDKTIVTALGTWYLLPYGVLSANRVGTLSASGANEGDVITIARQDVTNKTFTVKNHDGSTLYVFAASTAMVARFRFDGTDWSLLEIRQPETDARTVVDVPVPSLWTAYYDADTVYLPHNGDVTTWYSLVGSGVDLAAGGGTVKFNKNGVGGKPSVKTTASGYMISSAAALYGVQNGDDKACTVVCQFAENAIPSARTLWAWGKSDDATQRMRLLGASGTGWQVQRRGDSGGTLLTTGALAENLLQRVIAVTFTGTTVSVYDMSSDGYDPTVSHYDFQESLNTATMAVDRFSIGALYSNGAPANFATANYRRLAIASTALAEADLKTIYDAWWKK